MRAAFLVGLVFAASLRPAAEANTDRKRIPAFSVWIGEYRCYQGMTSMRLSIEARPNGEASASFEFGPHPDNKNLPKGELKMKGTIKLLSRGQLSIKLDPDRWITQPPGWTMVPVTATSDIEHRTLEGKMHQEHCGDLSAKRAEMD